MKTWRGTYTALITPFKGDKIDEEGFCHLIERQKKANVKGIVVLGSTGESATLLEDEEEKLISLAKAHCGDLKLIVGTGAYSTHVTLENTKRAKKLGADAALIVTPYYNKPMQEGLYAHFETIAKKCPLPFILYNHPGRCGSALETATIARLSKLDPVIGIKDCSSSLQTAIEIVNEIKTVRPEFALLSGDDIMTVPFISLGGDGVISVVSNLYPEKVVSMVDAVLESRLAEALDHFAFLYPFIKGTTIESNPIPIKAMMDMCKLPAGLPRLPLTPLGRGNHKLLEELFQ